MEVESAYYKLHMNVMNMISAGIRQEPSTESGRPGRAIPMSYWTKRRGSNRHVSWFFGQSVQVDVSVREIRKHGLGALLQSNVPLCYFLYYLLDNYCSENLFFYLEVEEFERHGFKNKDVLRRTARQIYTCFIREKSDFEVNLESRVTKPIKRAIEDGNHQCFADAKQAVYHLLEPSYVQFTLSPVFGEMAQALGESQTIYGKSERDAGVNILLQHLDKSLPSEVTGVNSSDQAIAAERTRARMLRNLIHSFCKTRLNCDFWDQEDQRNLAAINPAEIISRGNAANTPF